MIKDYEDAIQRYEDDEVKIIENVFTLPCVYFIIAEGTQSVKIGYTRRLASRFEELQHPSPVKLRLLNVIYSSDAKKLEKEFHRLLEKYRDRHEIFELPQEIIEAISRADPVYNPTTPVGDR